MALQAAQRLRRQLRNKAAESFGIFEADAQYIVGLNAQRPYNLYLLENPTRVVVDFQK